MIRDIFNTYREAFRVWVRSKTKPKTIHEAEEKRLFWAKSYLFCVTVGISAYLYSMWKEGINFNYDKDKPRALEVAKALIEGDSVRIIKYSGFTRLSSETVNMKDLKDQTSETKDS